MINKKDCYKILHLEDEKKDAELIAETLGGQDWNVEIKHVETKEHFEKALRNNAFDVVLVDYAVSQFDAKEAMQCMAEADIILPVIIVSGAIDDKKAADSLAHGAIDYVLKDKLFRLPAVVARAIEESRTKKEKEEIEESYEQFAETSPVGFYRMDSAGRCVYVNEGLNNLLGLPESKKPESDWLACVEDSDSERVRKLWSSAFDNKRDFEVETKMAPRGGKSIWVLNQAKPDISKEGIFEGYLGVIFDITRLKETELRLQELSYYDTLTNLPNRRFFQEHLHKALSGAKRHKENFALFYVDLDDFKKINDTKGHNFGDKFLEEVGRKFHEVLRDNDFIARIGGDEFAIIMEKYPREEDIVIMAERILKTMGEPYYIDEEVVHSSVSIGIATYPSGGENAEILLQHADLALYRAKANGRNCYQFYSQKTQEKLDVQVKIENMLRDAMANNELYLVYQPQINAQTRTLSGYEVLLRWNSPVLGEVSPVQFIPIAETSGYIQEIGMWVFEKAIEQYTHWQTEFGRDGFENVVVSINVSPAQILHQGISKDLINKIREANIPANSIMIEVTETAYMHDPELLQKVLCEIKEFGASIAVDDFGTGYSSLNIIEKLPINFLKIDTGFVRNMFNDKHNIPIIKAIATLSKALNFKVVAEGVETAKQAEVLTQIGCDHLQGYYFSKPLGAHQMEQYIQEMFKNRATGTD